MSQPLHSSRRLLISLFFILLFFIFIPIVLLYSIGYRLDGKWGLNATGGVYVFYPESGAKVFVDGILSDQTSLFERGIFIDDLKPSGHQVEVQKDGYIPWKKDVLIKEQHVTEAYPYLVPTIFSTSSVPRFVTLNSGVSVTNGLYGEVAKLFATSTITANQNLVKKIVNSTSTPVVASSTGILRRDIEIDVKGNKVIALWKGDEKSIPFYFCNLTTEECKDEMVVVDGAVKHVDFYPGRNDVIIYSTKDGIFATELDQRSPINTRRLLPGNLEFRENDDRVFVKEKTGYYELLFTASSTLVDAISI